MRRHFLLLLQYHVDFFILDDIVYLIYYNDECFIYKEHMVTINEMIRSLDNK